MDNSAPTQAGVAAYKEPSVDPVKAQGILRSVVKKETEAAKLWKQRWSFYTRYKEIQEEEAQKLGMSVEEYREGVRALSSQPVLKPYTDVMEASPKPLPLTTSGMIGRRALYPLERYGRLVRTGRDYPVHPPRPRGQAYDPYKQTMFFLGSVDVGDPISHRLPPEGNDIADELWPRSQTLDITPLDMYFRSNYSNGEK